MPYVMVDIESDGPCPGLYSMVALGAVVVEPGLERRFRAKFRPLEGARWEPDALAVSGFTREQTLAFPEARSSVQAFRAWLIEIAPGPQDWLMFVSDNNGFDWQFVNYYFHNFCADGFANPTADKNFKPNPFGHSSTNLGSLYKGVVKNMKQNFKHLRRTKHDHDPLNDALGNAEALLQIKEKYHLNIQF